MSRNFGFVTYDRVDAIGTNAKMTELSAALGLTNLESVHEFIEVNLRHERQYRGELAGLPGVAVLVHDERDTSNHHYLVIDIDPAEAALTRDEMMAVLHAEGVLARRYFFPGCHLTEPYRSRPGGIRPLPVTEMVANRVLCLPTGTAIGPEEISRICAVVRLALDSAGDVRRALGPAQVSS